MSSFLDRLPAVGKKFDTFEDLIEFFCPPNSILRTQELPFSMAELEQLSRTMKHRDEEDAPKGEV